MVDALAAQLDKERREVRILRVVLDEGPIGIVSLAEETDLPEHKVRYSLRMLENDGLVEATPQGAVPADDVAARLAEINEGIDDLIARLSDLRDAFER